MHWTKDSHHRNSGSPFSDLSKLSDCNDKLPFVCEKYNVSSLEKYSPDSAAKVQCTGKWIPFQNKVKRELLHCGSHDYFHSACTAWGRRAAQPDASLRGASSMPGTRITGTIDLLSQVRDAYRSLYSVVPNTKVAEVALTMAQAHWMVAANPTPWGNWFHFRLFFPFLPEGEKLSSFVSHLRSESTGVLQRAYLWFCPCESLVMN